MFLPSAGKGIDTSGKKVGCLNGFKHPDVGPIQRFRFLAQKPLALPAHLEGPQAPRGPLWCGQPGGRPGPVAQLSDAAVSPPPPPQASICRSSQPLSGFSARCLEDEQMLQAIRKANPGSDFIYVVDTRPKVSVAVLTLPLQLRVGSLGQARGLRLRSAPTLRRGPCPLPFALCTVSAWLLCGAAPWVTRAPGASDAPQLPALGGGGGLGTLCKMSSVCHLILEMALLNIPR